MFLDFSPFLVIGVRRLWAHRGERRRRKGNREGGGVSDKDEGGG